MNVTDADRPLAIAMWDFSWLERRWLGAGFENWNHALDELTERGYDAVRIDAYPHLISSDPEREWYMPPNPMPPNDWGSPGACRIQPVPALTDFVEKCADRDVQVGLSTWFREDEDNTRLNIESPTDLGEIWVDTLDIIDEAGLTDVICYVDLCNEFPHSNWAPYLNPPEENNTVIRNSDEGQRWMDESIMVVRDEYPDFDYCFSFSTEYDTWREQDISMMDVLELHLWMDQFSDFNDELGVKPYQGTAYYDALADRGKELYRENEEHWKNCLQDAVNLGAEWSRESEKPMMTTESWSLVFFRDWPNIEWDWIKELCEYGVRNAAETGRWIAISTSNFCGPQFRGMWQDVEWHRQMTDVIHDASIDVD